MKEALRVFFFKYNSLFIWKGRFGFFGGIDGFVGVFVCDVSTKMFIKTPDIIHVQGSKMLNQKFSAIILLTVMTMAVAAVVLTSGILFGSKTINNQGNVNAIGVGVYRENECINETTTINWGYIEPGSTQNVTIYIRNEGNIPMTLNMTTDNWNPSSASTYITLSWNQEGSQVNAQSVLETVLTLSVSSSISEIDSFSFDITITGTE